MPYKIMMIKFLDILHFAVVLFVIFGFLFASRPVLYFHLCFLPILVLHWKTNEGVCYITQLQNFIQPNALPKSDLQGGFSESLVVKLTGKKPSKASLQKIIYGIMLVSWSISLAKLL